MAARGDKSESRRLVVSREGIVGLHLLRELFPPVSIGPVLIYAENRLRIYIPGHELLKKKRETKAPSLAATPSSALVKELINLAEQFTCQRGVGLRGCGKPREG